VKLRGPIGLALVALALACREAPPESAPVEPRAAWLLEPPQIRIGEVATLERLVVTPPNWTVAPLQPAQPPAGFWLLDAEALPPEKRESRWLHRTQLRIRARELGRFEWPAGTAEVESADGTRQQLALPAQPLEVVSVLEDAPDQLTPFGVRPLPEAPARSLLAAAAAGALGSLATLGLVLLMMRRRRARLSASPKAAPREPPELRASADLAAARGALAADPRAAADAASAALRRFLQDRFGVPALSRTSEELAALAPPFALSTRWLPLVGLLGSLDVERFAPPARAVEAAQRTAPLLEAAERFLRDSLPPAAAR
jgi:hypothetical protein